MLVFMLTRDFYQASYVLNPLMIDSAGSESVGNLGITVLSCASAAHSNSRCYAELSFLEFSFMSCFLGGCRSDWLPGSERKRASTLDFFCVGG